eukprot:CAMPEP_0171183134 /NCGR_PEP_ID=MMETSP0790-20130122/15124_1 /TAXON_ID=2925 /ORGANISM="Alexandrium catenella, Strain OF101" /LENGTH=243 /DNA_ID=CAMNT_0011648105 /DNA_START=46 /DNA_END=777 /DNA_ORIENTATION=+
MVVSLLFPTIRNFCSKRVQADSLPPDAFLETGVKGVLRIPGRSWFGGGLITPGSLGPWGYVIVQGGSATLVDVPYYSESLVKEVVQLAPLGVTHLLFTHDDFVGMSGHASWKRAFPGAVRVAHAADCPKGSAEEGLGGKGPWDIAGAGVRAYHVPGHSEGSVFYVSPLHSAVFTGDSIAHWGGKPTAFGSRNRFGRATQASSLRAFVCAVPFCHAVLPGHGSPARFEDERRFAEFFEEAARGL